MRNYSYPLDKDWSTQEIITVMAFYNAVEKVYEKGIDVDAFHAAYQQFKGVVPAMSEEKRLGKEFESISGYSIYQAVNQMKTTREQVSAKSSRILQIKDKGGY